jgi:uncharacterized protein (TIGR02145 family)
MEISKPENCAIYGRLYDWETAMTVCPNGWHLPSSEEWAKLYEFAGGNDLKLRDVNGWSTNIIAGNNISDIYGFSALPGGCLVVNSAAANCGLGGWGWWWKAKESGESNADYVFMRDGYTANGTGSIGKNYHLSVRCVKN